MAVITELTEDFEGGAAGTNLTDANSQADNATPAGALTFNNDAYTGTRSLDVTVAAQNATARFNHALAGGWRGIAFKPITPDLTDTAIINWFAGTTKGGDIQWTPANRLNLRNVNSQVWASPVLASNTWYYLTLRITPTFRLRVWQGGNLFADSGDLSAPTVTSLDNLRIGMLSSSTGHCRFDRLRGDTTTEPTTGITPATAVAVYTQERVVEVDTAGSTGVMTLVQTSGEAATITGPVDGVFRVELPATYTEDLLFTLTASDGTSTDSETIVIPASGGSTGGGAGEPLVFTGSTWA